MDLVAGRGLAGPRLGRQRLDAHAQHERSNVPPPGMDAVAVQLVAQHARAHEGVFQVQLVEPAHEGQIGRTHRPGQVVDRAPADVQKLRLARDREFVVTLNHGFALSNPALVSALSKKSFSSVS